MTHDEVLAAISEKLTIMLASATPLVNGDDDIVGYQVKTGALHAIIGFTHATPWPVTVPVHKTAIRVQQS